MNHDNVIPHRQFYADGGFVVDENGGVKAF